MPQLTPRHTNLRSIIVWNTGSQLIGRAISAGTTFFVTLIIARSFGAAGYGDFVKITTFTAFFYLVADFGLNAVYLQKTTPPDGHTPGTDAVWSGLVGLRILMSCVLVLLAVCIVLLLPGNQRNGYTDAVRLGILLFTPSIIFQAMITSYNALFQKHFRYDYATLSLCFGAVATVLLLGFVVAGRFPLTMATTLWTLLIGGATTAAAGLFYSKKFIVRTQLPDVVTAYRSLFLPSIPLGLTLLFNVIYFHVDSIILTLTRPTAEVGIYGLAFKVFELPLVFPTFFMNALYPVLLKETGDKKQETSKRFTALVKTSAAYLFLASCFLSIVLWFASPLLAYIKSDFLRSVPALQILSLGLPFFFLSGLTMWILISKKRQKLLAAIYGISMVLNITLNCIFVPRFGYLAAAWITVISEAFVLAWTSGAVWREITAADKPATDPV